MLSLEEKLQAYQNFINNTNIDIKRREQQNQLRDKAIKRIFERLKTSNEKDREKLLKILSGLLVHKYLAYVATEEDKISLILNDISKRLILNEITEEEANEMRKFNQRPFSYSEIEYKCQLYNLIGIPINQEEYRLGYNMEEYMGYIKKMKIKSMLKK